MTQRRSEVTPHSRRAPRSPFLDRGAHLRLRFMRNHRRSRVPVGPRGIRAGPAGRVREAGLHATRAFQRPLAVATSTPAAAAIASQPMPDARAS